MTLEYRNIFVTGATGWLGKTLIKTLLQGDEQVLSQFIPKGYHVHAFLMQNEQLEFSSKPSILEEFMGDVNIKKDCEAFLKHAGQGDILIHTAGVIHPKKVSDFYAINLEGTKNVVETAIEKGVSKIIVISSNSPIGCNISNKPDDLFDEKSPYNPYMHYGKSKMGMEKYLLSKVASEVDITIIRPPWFYGENMPPRQLTFYKMIKEGKFPMIGNGENLRSMVHTKNLVQGILLCASNPISRGQIYWIADKTPYSMNTIIKTVRNVLEELGVKTKDQKIRLPHFISQIAQLLDHIFQAMGIYSQKMHVVSELNKNIACSIEKAERELHYTPKLDLYQGTKEVLKTRLNIFNEK